MYKILFERRVQKFLEKQKGQKIISQLETSLHILATSPYENNLDISILAGTQNCYRLRIGKYRFLYEIIEEKIIITFYDAGSRGDIYK